MKLQKTRVEVDAMVNPHSHLREGYIMKHLIWRALEGGVDVLGPQPNTENGLCGADDATSYIDYAKACVPEESALEFIPFLMLTEKTTAREIELCTDCGIFDAKIYPQFRTTLSGKGIRYYHHLLEKVRYAATYGMRIHLHPEHPWPLIPNRDAEYQFLSIAEMLLQTDATLFWEHGSDARCIPFWKEMAKTGRFYLTLTAHHLATNEDAAYGDVGAVCKPPYKTPWDQTNLVQLVCEDHPWVMAIGDDAPHDMKTKHVTGPCACGAYTAPFLLPIFAHTLSDLLMSQKGSETFVNFTSRNARRIFKLPPASHTRMLIYKPFLIPMSYEIGPWTVEPFWAGKTLDWSLE